MGPAHPWVTGALLTAWLFGGSVARAEEAVTLELGTLLRMKAPTSSATNAFRVDARNRTGQPLRGRIVVEVTRWHPAQQVAARYELPLDLPPRDQRTVEIDVDMPHLAANTTARYIDDANRVLASATMVQGPTGDPPPILVVARDARLAQALPETLSTKAGVSSTVLEPTTGEPRLPRTAAAYQAVALVVLDGALLSRIDAEVARALVDWVMRGGRLLVFVRNDNDARTPWLRAIAGDIAPAPQSHPAPDLLTPTEAAAASLGGSKLFTEPYGAYARHGFGTVFLAGYDGGGRFATDAATRRLVESVAPELASAQTSVVQEPRLRFEDVQRALDPNASFRPALALVAVLLGLYVLVVGPVSFRWIARRNRPTLALLTTPLAAAACSGLIFVTAVVSKGVLSRHRSVEIVSGVEGETHAVWTAYRGLFPTRPLSFSLDVPQRGELRRANGVPGRQERYTLGTQPVRLAGLSAGFWDTFFVQEERIAPLGAIVFEREGGRVAGIVNGSGKTLRGAVFRDATGSFYAVGDVPPGRRVAVPESAGALDARRTFAEGRAWLGTSPDELLDAMDAKVSLFAGRPTLFATMDAERVSLGPFRDDGTLRIVRVAAREVDRPLVTWPRVESDEKPKPAGRTIPSPDENPPPVTGGSEHDAAAYAVEPDAVVGGAEPLGEKEGP